MDGEKDTYKMARDAVCGMKVKEGTGYSMNYKGKEYHFCSADCRKAFELNPEKYIENRRSID